jgi:hypothetical protein
MTSNPRPKESTVDFGALAAADLIHWHIIGQMRDHLVRRAHAAGLSIHQVHRYSGVGRIAILRVLAKRRPDQLHMETTPLVPEPTCDLAYEIAERPKPNRKHR